MRNSLIPLLSLILQMVGAAEERRFFAMDTIARGSPEKVAPLLKELGYAGIGGQAGDEAMAKAMEQSGLRFFNGYLTIDFDDTRPALDDSLRATIDRMRDRQTTLWMAVRKVVAEGRPIAPSSPEADDLVVARLAEIADHAKTRGVRIALYPHTSFWIEKVEDALRVSNRLDRPDVGVTFNLCHWLKVEGSARDPSPVLRAAMPRLMFVTINGADTGETRDMDWKRLIQPLGSGTYDVRDFLGKLAAAGYSGPIGFQGFGIEGDPREVLADTMKAWNGMKPSDQENGDLRSPATKAP